MPATSARRWGWDGPVPLVVATLAVLGIHLLANRSAGPVIVYDEAGYLGNARWLAGQHPTFAMPLSPFYAWGYSAVIAPVHWLSDDPRFRWHAILTVNALLLASLVPLLHRLARSVFGVGRRVTLAAAVVGALCPAALGTTGQAAAENLSLPLVVVVVLALHAALASQRIASRLLLGPAVAALYASHPRFLPVVAVVALGLLVGLVVAVVPRVVTAANLLGLAVGVVLVRWVDALLVADRWRAVAVLEGDAGDLVDQLSTGRGVELVARAALGQGWYLAVGTLGVSVVGVWGLVRIASGRPLVEGADGDGDRDRDTTPTAAARITAVGTVVMALGVFALSVYFFSRNATRDDQLLYGRHNDSFLPIWVAAGVALLLGERARVRLTQTLVGAGAAVAVVSGLVIVALNPVTHGGRYIPRAIPALSRVVEGSPDGVFVRGSLFALAGLVVMAVVALVVRRPLLGVVALTLWFGWVGMARVERVETKTERAYDDWSAPEELRALGVSEAAIDSRTVPIAVLTYQFALPDVRFLPYLSGRDRRPDVAFVVASSTDAALVEAGGRLVVRDDPMSGGDPTYDVGLWVLPGPERDRLEAEGRLLPQ
ncbi:hypothetical protein BH24ACT4_BH24ACT4_14470 [soil metagenome]